MSVMTEELKMESGRLSAARAGERGMRIAVASSGLGHISRGIETWAADLGRALRAAGQDATLFQGAGTPSEDWQQVVPCKLRFDAGTQQWVRRFRKLGGWRYGCGSGYEIEQTTFALGLWRRIRRDYDILHVQDPQVALVLDRLNGAGLSRPKVILAHGTEETPALLRKYSALQHLAPCYLDEWEPQRPHTQYTCAIPNFVDVERFCPGDRAAARRRWDLPQDALVVLCVAAIKKHHKRMDYLLREFACFADQAPRDALLVIAGAREEESDEVMALGRDLLGSRVRFLEGVKRQEIPTLYQASDLFALASLHEMMPIAVLEALASGLPVVCNDTPTLRWMVGPGGDPADLSREGSLASAVARCSEEEQLVNLSRMARKHAVATFSEAPVVGQILGMYRAVLGAGS
jgi:glycosyltransferase involved in cell wall biosynthesis